MNAIEELLSEEVRRYEHLYNPSMAGYKDAQMASNSWREISSNVVLAVDLCLKMWRRLRDKYVREKKAILLPFFIAFLVGRTTTTGVKDYNSHSAVQAGEGGRTAEEDEADEPARS
ncbi:hypothetical protein EYF80_034881 [Liparis tanakae]|uniref:MADF domain-containing protein n=1 Tax=Liparis tanakae TaxID=230148 RepID=A0A4Z2GN43_9TELE|nr:hypothetical protein EYF80_034881 [Liparis tanakae]